MASQITSLTVDRLLRQRPKKASKFCVASLCEGNSPVTCEFPAQRASNVENISIWWRHHYKSYSCSEPCQAGFYRHPTYSLCYPCPRGQYQNEAGTTECSPCPDGRTTMTAAATSLDDCIGKHPTLYFHKIHIYFSFTYTSRPCLFWYRSISPPVNMAVSGMH